MRRAFWLTLAIVLLLPAAAVAANHDREVQQFFLPGTNTSGFRVHSARAALAHMNLTIPRGNIWAVGGYKTPLRFVHTALSGLPPAALTAVAIGLDTTGVLYQRLGYEGNVIGLTLAASDALTAGTATARATIRKTTAGTVTVGLTQLTVTLGGAGPSQFASATQARGRDTFRADQEVGCQLTTSANIAPGGAQLACTVVVDF